MRLHSSPYLARLGFLPSSTFIFLLLGASQAYNTLSEKSLRSLPSPGSDFDIHNGSLLAPILQPRVPGSPGSAAVLEHFVSFFRTSLPEWHLEFQNLTSKTPATGDTDLPFVNLIARRDPPWAGAGEVGRLTLAAHYDSKMDPPGFIGAIDSAAPCAMILHAARTVNDALTKKWARMRAEGAADNAGLGDEEKGVQVIFLDGEEAFKQWSETDSLYGARSLAEHWDKTTHPALSTYRTPLSSIRLFMLLDLLGSVNPVIPSYFRTTHWAYKNLATLEHRLRSLSMFKSSPNHPAKQQHDHPLPRNREVAEKDQPKPEPLFLPDMHKDDLGVKNNNNEIGSPFAYQGTIIDDHIPFMERGVEVLHLIPASFPSIWHTIHDDGAHLDLDTVEDWAILVAAFVAEWMGLEGFLPQKGGGPTSTLIHTTTSPADSPRSAIRKRTELAYGEDEVIESGSLFRPVGELVDQKVIISKTEL